MQSALGSGRKEVLDRMDAQNEFVSGACYGYEALLEDYLEGTLDTANARKVSEHLRTCTDCSLAVENAAPAAKWLRAAEPTPDPGPGFARIVMARVRMERDARGRVSVWEPLASLAWKFATTAALALVIMLVYASRGNSVPVADVPQVSATSSVADSLALGQTSVPMVRGDLISMVTESDNGQR